MGPDTRTVTQTLERATHCSGWEDATAVWTVPALELWLLRQKDQDPLLKSLTLQSRFVHLRENRSRKTRFLTSLHHQIPSLPVAEAALCSCVPVKKVSKATSHWGDRISSPLAISGSPFLQWAVPQPQNLPPSFLQDHPVGTLLAPASPGSPQIHNPPFPHEPQAHNLISWDSEKCHLQPFTALPHRHFTPALSTSLEVTRVLHSVKSNGQLSSGKKHFLFHETFLLPLVLSSAFPPASRLSSASLAVPPLPPSAPVAGVAQGSVLCPISSSSTPWALVIPLSLCL